eukprot:762958-Hanusia_phi.AAC.11
MTPAPSPAPLPPAPLALFLPAPPAPPAPPTGAAALLLLPLPSPLLFFSMTAAEGPARRLSSAMPAGSEFGSHPHQHVLLGRANVELCCLLLLLV